MFRRGIRTERIRKSHRRSGNRSSSTACSADVRLGGASGGTEAHQDEPGDRGGSHSYYTYFSSCFNKSHPPLTALPPDPSSASTVRHDPSLDEMYCTVSEVAQLLQNVDLSKASGSDKISARMLKSTASSIAPSIHKLFNLSIQLGRIPHQWKHSMIVPIPKSTRMADPGNYRPISLISILCKLLEKHICSLMHDHLSNSHQLANSQWGFRSGRSTVTALLSVTHDWFSALECGKEVCAVFFDYRKAFDSVPHQPLLKSSSPSISVKVSFVGLLTILFVGLLTILPTVTSMLWLMANLLNLPQ